MSTTWARILVRIACFKNNVPRPIPSLAPSISPGKSAITNDSPFFSLTTPRFGFNVVKWYAAIFGFDALITDRIVDLPTLGIPTSPTSANTFSSSLTITSSPGSPFSLNFGAGTSWVANDLFPFPPRPPLAATNSSPSVIKSAITSFVFVLITVVPSGTIIIISSAFLPYLFAPLPFSPFGALIILR